jgi:hypothetical protein
MTFQWIPFEEAALWIDSSSGHEIRPIMNCLVVPHDLVLIV